MRSKISQEKIHNDADGHTAASFSDNSAHENTSKPTFEPQSTFESKVTDHKAFSCSKISEENACYEAEGHVASSCSETGSNLYQFFSQSQYTKQVTNVMPTLMGSSDSIEYNFKHGEDHLSEKRSANSSGPSKSSLKYNATIKNDKAEQQEKCSIQ